jgi:hypothetical protein
MTNDVRLREVMDEGIPIFYEQLLDSVANQIAAFPARERMLFRHIGPRFWRTKAILSGPSSSMGRWQETLSVGNGTENDR